MWKFTHWRKLLTTMQVDIKAGTPWDTLEFGLSASISQILTFLKRIKCCKLSAKQVVNRWSHLYSFVWCIFCLYVFSGKTPKKIHPPSFCRADGSAPPHLFYSLGLQHKLFRWSPKLSEFTTKQHKEIGNLPKKLLWECFNISKPYFSWCF